MEEELAAGGSSKLSVTRVAAVEGASLDAVEGALLHAMTWLSNHAPPHLALQASRSPESAPMSHNEPWTAFEERHLACKSSVGG